MTPDERLAAKKIARIMRAARKQLSLTQEGVASHLGISQSALSKLERGTLIPSAPQWFEFCRMTQISPESLLSGVIERNSPASLEEGLRKGTFKIPRRYARQRGSKIRALLPFLRFMQQRLGDEKFFEFFVSKKIDADYFIDLDNQISIEFLFDVASVLIQGGFLKPDHLSDLTSQVALPEMHGSLKQVYDAKGSALDRLEALLQNSKLYECNFRYEVVDRGEGYLDFSFTPEEHLGALSQRIDSDLGNFLFLYKKSYFESFLNYGLAQMVARALDTLKVEGAGLMSRVTLRARVSPSL